MPSKMIQEPYDFVIDEIVSIAKIDTSKDWRRIDLTYKDTWVFCYALSGSCRYVWENGGHTIGSGDAALFAPGFTRSAQSSEDDPWTFVVLKFHLSAVNDAARRMLATLPVYMPRLQKKVSELTQHCESVWRAKRPTYILRCKSLVCEILCRLIQEAEKETLCGVAAKRIAPAMRLLNEGGDLGAEELAAAAGLSVSHFRTLFRQTTGYSVVQYRNYLRVTRARDLLLMSNNYTVGQVAELVGIPDLFYFSRLFKQYIGVPPSQVREI